MKQTLLIMLGLSVSLFANFSRDSSTQIVTDNSTTLQWQDDANASSMKKNWTDAITYCETMTLGEHTDWRLPNFNELYFIVDRSKSNPAMDADFINVSSHDYWSSSTFILYKHYAWSVFFGEGSDHWKTKSSSHYVRCVRDAE